MQSIRISLDNAHKDPQTPKPFGRLSIRLNPDTFIHTFELILNNLPDYNSNTFANKDELKLLSYSKSKKIKDWTYLLINAEGVTKNEAFHIETVKIAAFLGLSTLKLLKFITSYHLEDISNRIEQKVKNYFVFLDACQSLIPQDWSCANHPAGEPGPLIYSSMHALYSNKKKLDKIKGKTVHISKEDYPFLLTDVIRDKAGCYTIILPIQIGEGSFSIVYAGVRFKNRNNLDSELKQISDSHASQANAQARLDSSLLIKEKSQAIGRFLELKAVRHCKDETSTGVVIEKGLALKNIKSEVKLAKKLKKDSPPDFFPFILPEEIAVYYKDNHLQIRQLMEFCPYNLLEFLQLVHGNFLQITDEDKLHLLANILQGLAILEKNEILHNDIKEENIMLALVSETWQAKIADFGLKETYNEIRKNRTEKLLGTPGYLTSCYNSVREKKIAGLEKMRIGRNKAQIEGRPAGKDPVYMEGKQEVEEANEYLASSKKDIQAAAFLAIEIINNGLQRHEAIERSQEAAKNKNKDYIAKLKMMEIAEEEIAEGTELVELGHNVVNRGQELLTQGKIKEGQASIAEGKHCIKLGQDLLEKWENAPMLTSAELHEGRIEYVSSFLNLTLELTEEELKEPFQGSEKGSMGYLLAKMISNHPPSAEKCWNSIQKIIALAGC